MSDVQGQTATQAAASGSTNVFVMKEFELRFKAPAERIVNKLKAEGKPVPATRENFKVVIPQYTNEGILELANKSEKVRDFLRMLVNNTIEVHTRAQATADENPANSDSEIDKSKLELEYIASLSKEDLASASSSVTKEQLLAFATDFKVAIQPIANLKENVAEVVSEVLRKRFTAEAKANPKIMAQLQNWVRLYAAEAPNAEQHAEVVAFLDARATDIMTKEDENSLAALLG